MHALVFVLKKIIDNYDCDNFLDALTIIIQLVYFVFLTFWFLFGNLLPFVKIETLKMSKILRVYKSYMDNDSSVQSFFSEMQMLLSHIVKGAFLTHNFLISWSILSKKCDKIWKI